MLILWRNPNRADGEIVSVSNEVYFDSGSGVGGLRRLSPHLTKYFMGFGLDRLIEHLSNTNPVVSCRALPALKSAVDAMPSFQMEKHLGHDLHCVICKDAFEIGEQALEMPCKHIYRSPLPSSALHQSFTNSYYFHHNFVEPAIPNMMSFTERGDSCIILRRGKSKVEQ